MIQGSVSDLCFVVSSHTTCCETIIVCWEIWSFQREMHPHAEDSIAYGHPRSSKQCWEAGNKPSLLEGVAERAWTYIYISMFACYHYIYTLQNRTHVAFCGLGRRATPNLSAKSWKCHHVKMYLQLNNYQIVHCKSLPCWIVVKFFRGICRVIQSFSTSVFHGACTKKQAGLATDKSGGPRRPRTFIEIPFSKNLRKVCFVLGYLVHPFKKWPYFICHM